jgi:T5SS/PEP-CTERM-associated repeat protein/autotransporter-associated beta strand protein
VNTSLGETSSALGTATVSGVDSELTNTGDLFVGHAMFNTSASLTISNGGHVTNTNGYIGYDLGTGGTVTVEGAGSTWTNSNVLSVGYGDFATATLKILNGATVTDQTGTIGATPKADVEIHDGGGLVVVSGAGAQWTNSTALPVGRGLESGSFTGSRLTIQSGGVVSVAAGAGTVTLGIDGGSLGILDIGSPDLSNPTTAGVLQASQVAMENFRSTVNFNQTDSILFAAALTGPGSVAQRGSGITTLTAANTYAGPTIISGGTLEFATRSSFYNANPVNWSPGKLTVGPGATAAFRVGGPGEFTAADLDLIKVIGNGAGGFQAGATLGFDTTNAAGGAFTYSSDIRDSHFGTLALGLAKLGEGTLTLDGSSSYTGGTTIFAGTLIPGSVSALGTGSIVVKGGTLQLQSGIAIPNAIVLAGGSLAQQLGAGAGLATLGDFNGDVTGGIITTASILGGDASAPATIQTGFALDSPASNDNIRQSDIFTLTGIPIVDAGTGATDVFVLQLKIANVTADSFLAWYNPASMAWVNAVEGNHGGTNSFGGVGAYDPATDFHLGTWGVDVSGGAVWAVLNHNSDFAITGIVAVPEPQEYALAIATLLGGLIILRRRRAGIL